VISGFLPADGGQVLLGGKDVTRRPPHRRAIAQLGRSFQEARLYPSLTVTEVLLVALECHLRNRDPLAAAMHLPVATMSERSAMHRAGELIDLLGLRSYRDHPTGELSTGTRRIVELGCLLAHDPAVVLLDEPSAGVAQRETEALGPLLRRVQQQTGCSLVIIEHDMALLSSLCDALIALEEGAVIAAGPPEQVLADHRVVASYLGTEHEVVQRSNHQRPGAYTMQPMTVTGRPRFGRSP
jgi:ABC-type branched-subunit amino acid transport system ATPase component